MKCPFCGGDMQPGIIKYNSNMPLRWIPENTPKSGLDRFWDVLGGIGILTAGQRSKGKLKSDFCPACKRMIFETDITK